MEIKNLATESETKHFQAVIRETWFHKWGLPSERIVSVIFQNIFKKHIS